MPKIGDGKNGSAMSNEEEELESIMEENETLRILVAQADAYIREDLKSTAPSWLHEQWASIADMIIEEGF